MITYDNFGLYIIKDRDLRSRICNIDKVIDALIVSAANSAGTANFSEYDLDNGQSKVKTVYRSPKDVSDAIMAFEKIKQMFINQLNGRTFRMIDEKNLMRTDRNGYYNW